jgi:hypothetical protein
MSDMMTRGGRWIVALTIGSGVSATSVAAQGAAKTTAPNYVSIVPHEADRRVDVLIGGVPFTAYVWPTSLKKPVLFPLRAANGAVVTRGYPLEPRPGERIDHPHHAGLWFNYGDVNGLDFWNNSDAIAADNAPKMGTIVHQRVRDVTSGAGKGTLSVASDWVNHAGKTLLRENTEFVFRSSAGVRSIERITTLSAADDTVHFKDNKEGVIGLRVARSLEQPSMTPEKFTDASGRATNVARMDTAGVHGLYRSSEGKEGDAVWGTRGKWTMLTGDVNGTPVTVAILDHPGNPGYPTYWHARGYGLFAANPLGQKAMSNGKEELNFVLAPKRQVVFRHQVLILDGKATPADIDRYYQAFVR